MGIQKLPTPIFCFALLHMSRVFAFNTYLACCIETCPPRTNIPMAFMYPVKSLRRADARASVRFLSMCGWYLYTIQYTGRFSWSKYTPSLLYRYGVSEKENVLKTSQSFVLHQWRRSVGGLAVWCSGNALVSINAVALHRARLVLGWVTAFGQVNCLIT